MYLNCKTSPMKNWKFPLKSFSLGRYIWDQCGGVFSFCIGTVLFRSTKSV